MTFIHIELAIVAIILAIVAVALHFQSKTLRLLADASLSTSRALENVVHGLANDAELRQARLQGADWEAYARELYGRYEQTQRDLADTRDAYTRLRTRVGWQPGPDTTQLPQATAAGQPEGDTP
jgi:hypothetical protein